MDGEDEIGPWAASVAELAGIQSNAHARAALLSVLDGLGAMVPHARRAAVIAELPLRLAEALARRDYDRALGRPWLLDVVAQQEHVRTGSAIEHVQSVLSVLRDRVDPDHFRVFVAELPPAVAALVPPQRTSTTPPPPGRPAHGHAHHLADGRPGFAHAIAESAPPTRAQSHSVAASDAPHADTKLSGAPGLTQQREHTSLAEAHPGPARTLAEPEE